ncbi:MAG: tripartite tricarboxylate transporter substrate binding protein [Pigmentiphaga sp.]|uniref:Bug family tripartite tricarboxylate transporter substrate binding protein n=1 Tax=Pigmentiphaga sp. TaxID=1977564 RepID=UPI0029A9086D|nr:tripartite tricarboxylate transporter substrate binding protein [Pigmentiphaga sp.]MDX3905322.1 tripartite tricarboxylate transporter substrate binding protein [Pigmentiphaga sp.]
MLCAALAACAGPARAADYPSRPVMVVNTWAPGGPSDAIIRPLLEKFSQRFGQPFVLENRSGANGSIGTSYVARARNDGYTLLFANVGPIAISPWLPDKPNYDSIKDFQPIGQIVSGSTVLVVAPSFPANTMQQFIDYAKKNPGKITYGSVGIGSSTHVAGATLAKMANIEMVHAPYRGSSQIQVDIMSGQIQSAFVNLGGALELIRAGKLKAIAVSTESRSSVLPDVPAVAETVPGFDFNVWYGLMAPAGTPKEIVETLSAALKETMALPDIKDRLLASGLDPHATGPEEFGKKVEQDLAAWKRAVANAHLTP